MGFPFEDLDDTAFERLTVQGMRKLFGAGVTGFAAGPDGGRDARFDGTAELFPSSNAPWSGLTVGQAKHTSAFNAHCSDPDFSGAGETSVLSVEVERLKKLRASGELDNYFLVTNRRLGAITNTKLIEFISREVGLPRSSVFVAGLEFIDDLLTEYPDLPTLARVSLVDSPLLVSSQELAELILGISEELRVAEPRRDAPVVDRIPFTAKNVANSMTEEFASALSRRYLSYTFKIADFLSNPANGAAVELYEAAVEEFQLKIIAHRSDYQTFDNLFNYLVDLLFKRDGVLSRNRRLTRAMLFYMYWHCDIGETPDAAS